MNKKESNEKIEYANDFNVCHSISQDLTEEHCENTEKSLTNDLVHCNRHLIEPNGTDKELDTDIEPQSVETIKNNRTDDGQNISTCIIKNKIRTSQTEEICSINEIQTKGRRKGVWKSSSSENHLVLQHKKPDPSQIKSIELSFTSLTDTGRQPAPLNETLSTATDLSQSERQTLEEHSTDSNLEQRQNQQFSRSTTEEIYSEIVDICIERKKGLQISSSSSLKGSKLPSEKTTMPLPPIECAQTAIETSHSTSCNKETVLSPTFSLGKSSSSKQFIEKDLPSCTHTSNKVLSAQLDGHYRQSRPFSLCPELERTAINSSSILGSDRKSVV